MTAIDAKLSRTNAPVPACRCTHCGLDVPSGLVESDAPEQFCCNGCRTAWSVIHTGGLASFYEYARRASSAVNTARDHAADAYAHFDDPAFARLYCRPADGGATGATLRVDGMHCAACVWLLERLDRADRSGAIVCSRVDLRRGLLTVVWDPAKASLSRIARLCATLGYPLSPPRGLSVSAARRAESRAQLVRVGIAGAILGNVMLVALALFAGGAATGVEGSAAMDAGMSSFFRRLSMALSLVSLAGPGSVFFRGAWAAFRTRAPSMDIPIALGLGLGAAWGTVNAVRGTGQVYFDTICTLVFLLLLGRWIQFSQQRRASDAVELLFSITTATARLVEGDSIRVVPVESLTADSRGCIVEVEAGGTVPVDGVVTSGSSDLDVSLLSGESRPTPVRAGHAVAAGSVNLTAPIRVRVEAAGEATRVGKLMRLVEDSAQRRAPIVRLADRLSRVFVPVVLALAALTGSVWAFIRPGVAIDNAAALLITTCPCALGLATPLAVIVSIGRAAKRGILVKGGDTLEALASRPGIMLLDKTGTITQGRVSIVRTACDARTLRLAAAVESGSNHPVARAIVASAPAAHAPSPSVSGVSHTLGRGVRGTVDGHDVVVGSPAFARTLLGAFDHATDETIARMLVDGLSPVVVCVGGTAAGVLGLGDAPRDDAANAINRLRHAGWEIRIISGDDPSIVERTARAVGIDPLLCSGAVSPEGKLAEVRRLRALHPDRSIVMVGDGVNDAAALSAATVGVAVHGSAEASLSAADVFLSRPGLASLVELTSGARRTLSVIKRNLFASLAYNALFVTLAASGVLTPLIAAVVMPFSSLTVVLLSVHARSFKSAGDTPWK